MHIMFPAHRVKFLRAYEAHVEARTKSLRAEVDTLTAENTVMSADLHDCKDALESSKQLNSTLRSQLDTVSKQYDELTVEHRASKQRLRDLGQPTLMSPQRSPPRSTHRTSTPYDRFQPSRAGQTPTVRRTTQDTSGRPQAQVPVVLDPDSAGDVILASFPSKLQPMRMHAEQPRYINRRPCAIANFRWKADNGIEIVGLPKTRAGTPYLPSDLGIGWHMFENNTTSIDEVFRRIDLLFRNRKEELWLAATRAAFEFRRLITPLPEVMKYMIHLSTLRKSVWTIIDEGISDNAGMSIVSPGCRLHGSGYGGLFTPDVQLWAIIHTITDVDTIKLSGWSGRTVTTADLKKMVKDALCSGNYFDITADELAKGVYKLPRLAHYDGALDMDKVVSWLKTTVGMTPYMVHAHFRPFLRRVYDTPAGARLQPFEPGALLPGEAVPPEANEDLIDFPASRDWIPSRGPRTPLIALTSAAGATANALLLAPSGDTADSAPASLASAPPESEDADMVGPEEIAANASPSVASRPAMN